MANHILISFKKKPTNQIVKVITPHIKQNNILKKTYEYATIFN